VLQLILSIARIIGIIVAENTRTPSFLEKNVDTLINPFIDEKVLARLQIDMSDNKPIPSLAIDRISNT